VTIREYINRRMWKLVWIALLPLLALQLAMKIFSHWPQVFLGLPADLLAFVTLLYFLGSVVWTERSSHTLPMMF
jgi:hypothetical protein